MRHDDHAMFVRCLPLVLVVLTACSGLHSSLDASVEDSGGTGGGGGGGGMIDAGPACDAGFHACASYCVADDSLTQCGAACLPCIPPSNATASCTGGSCDFTCASPLLKCAGACCKAIAVTAGNEHTCVLTDRATVKCWGSGSGIGDGMIINEHLVSVDIAVGGDAGVAQVSASLFNTCARLTSGALRCWGNNGSGSVGDGTTFPRGSAVEVFGQGVSDVALGAFFGCAVVGEGVQCWGNGTSGQLGDGAGADRSSPGSVSGLLFGVSAVWAGFNTACVATDAGFRCWGANGSGEAGDLTSVHPRLLPVVVKAVDAGILELHPALQANCAVTTTHGVKCFGAGFNGQCGDGTINGPHLSSVNALGLGGGVIQLASGSGNEHFCAVLDGGAFCWGLNDKGQIGDTTVVNKLAPTPVFGLPSGVRSIATGSKHTCAVTVQGGAKCWGSNKQGQLGDGTKSDHWIPMDVR